MVSWCRPSHCDCLVFWAASLPAGQAHLHKVQKSHIFSKSTLSGKNICKRSWWKVFYQVRSTAYLVAGLFAGCINLCSRQYVCRMWREYIHVYVIWATLYWKNAPENCVLSYHVVLESSFQSKIFITLDTIPEKCLMKVKVFTGATNSMAHGNFQGQPYFTLDGQWVWEYSVKPRSSDDTHSKSEWKGLVSFEILKQMSPVWESLI